MPRGCLQQPREGQFSGEVYVELTKLKIELYDIAAIVIPRIFCLAEVWVALFGAPSLLHFLHDLKGTELTLVVLCSFALGNLVQEAGQPTSDGVEGEALFQTGA